LANRNSRALARFLLLVGFISFSAATSCGSGDARPEYPQRAEQWFERAQASYRQADIDDAASAIRQALELTPQRVDARILAAKIALANLEYAQTLGFLKGMQGTEALGLRARALWYSGKIEEAADALDGLLADPSVRDDWAKQVARLARLGAGRDPFRMAGGRLAVVDIPAGVNALLVPVEVNGDPALGLIATGSAETVIDSRDGNSPAWISLRFGDRLEVKDVPAISQDLSGLSRTLGAPIKLLLGANLLRHLNPTIDLAGGQFVLRTTEPGPPPEATTVRVIYARGGGMTVRASVGSALEPVQMPFFVDTMFGPPIAMNEQGWAKAGFKVSGLEQVPSQPALKWGVLPMVKLGEYGVANVAAVYPATIPPKSEIEFMGVMGLGLVGAFRVTLFDKGRAMWVEELAPGAMGPAPAAQPEQPAAQPSSPATVVP
jgi:hypothetical protein